MVLGTGLLFTVRCARSLLFEEQPAHLGRQSGCLRIGDYFMFAALLALYESRSQLASVVRSVVLCAWRLFTVRCARPLLFGQPARLGRQSGPLCPALIFRFAALALYYSRGSSPRLSEEWSPAPGYYLQSAALALYYSRSSQLASVVRAAVCALAITFCSLRSPYTIRGANSPRSSEVVLCAWRLFSIRRVRRSLIFKEPARPGRQSGPLRRAITLRSLRSLSTIRGAASSPRAPERALYLRREIIYSLLRSLSNSRATSPPRSPEWSSATSDFCPPATLALNDSSGQLASSARAVLCVWRLLSICCACFLLFEHLARPGRQSGPLRRAVTLSSLRTLSPIRGAASSPRATERVLYLRRAIIYSSLRSLSNSRATSPPRSPECSPAPGDYCQPATLALNNSSGQLASGARAVLCVWRLLSIRCQSGPLRGRLF